METVSVKQIKWLLGHCGQRNCGSVDMTSLCLCVFWLFNRVASVNSPLLLRSSPALLLEGVASVLFGDNFKSHSIF